MAVKYTGRVFGRYLWAMCIIGVVGGILIGLIIAWQLSSHFNWARNPNMPVTLSIILVCFVIMGFLFWHLPRALRRPVSELMTERVRWLRGGEAEAFVALAMRTLEDEWHLFNNAEIRDIGDLDHVLVGPGGIFCLSTKSYKGIYSLGSGGEFLLNGEPSPDLADARKQAMKLRDWLSVKLHRSPVVKDIPWIQPVLVAPFAKISLPHRQEVAWIYDQDQLSDLLHDSPRKLAKPVVQACAAAVQEISGQPVYVAPVESK